jgi:hypothetical protein
MSVGLGVWLIMGDGYAAYDGRMLGLGGIEYDESWAAEPQAHSLRKVKEEQTAEEQSSKTTMVLAGMLVSRHAETYETEQQSL